jgi:protein-tyrosine phosphatase
MVMGTGKAGYDLTWVTDQLAVGGAPMSYVSLESLRAEGVEAILNLCDEFCDLHWIEAGEGFDVYYFPIPDEETPDLAELEKALDWLDESIYLGKHVLIHCRHGIGRTGTVLNAYLLRKGLGHKLAHKKLKSLRSKPQNFDQWRFIRRYGKQERELTIREPSLESRHLVDLTPFFKDYERVVSHVDALIGEGGEHGLCGRDHSACCTKLVTMPLVEAVYINHAMNLTLSQQERQNAIGVSAGAGKQLRQLGYDPQDPTTLTGAIHKDYAALGTVCPLNEWGECRIFDRRPLPCRLTDLPPEKLGDPLMTNIMPAALSSISSNLFFAFTSRFLTGTPLSFILPDVISGKFVQTFFYQLMRTGE